jgi:chromosome segregation ATPase
MQKVALVSAFATVANAEVTNPMNMVIQLMDDTAAKIRADGEAEAKAFKEYFEWCDDVSKNSGFEIKTAKASKEKLEAKIGQLSSDISTGTSKIEDLTEAISAAEKELAEATAVREKEEADFKAEEAELVDGVDTLGRAIGILEREAAKNPAAFAQIDTTNLQSLTQAIGTVIDAAAFSSNDRKKLLAMVQSNSDDDDSDSGAPAAAAYKNKSGGIVDVLEDMKEKAEGELSDLRKAEGASKQNFMMLKQSLENQLAADNKEFDDEKSGVAAAKEEKAAAEGDLVSTTKELANAESDLANSNMQCMQVAADHEATIAARSEELGVIAKAKEILQESTSGAVGQSYDFLQIQLKTRTDLANSEVIQAIKDLAAKEHSVGLSQLASRVQAVVAYGSGNGEDVFAKIKGMISDMITKLEKEAEEDATEKAYCDEEMAKTQAKKDELDSEIESLTTKIDRAASKSAQLKADVKELQEELAALAKETAEMDQIRSEQNKDYREASADLKQGLAGVQKALGMLREYYGGAAFVQDDAHFGAFMQQPSPPAQHSKSSGAGGSIIDILEVVESDFSKDLAKEEAAESDAQADYDKTTQMNKISKAQKEQDVKYFTQEFKSLDKEISELSSDKGTAGSELSAVMEYYDRIKDRCIAKPESYEERAARRKAEIEGLKTALNILDNETAFVQRKRRGGQRHLRA